MTRTRWHPTRIPLGPRSHESAVALASGHSPAGGPRRRARSLVQRMKPHLAVLVPVLFSAGAAMPVVGQTTAVVHAGVTSARVEGAGEDDSSGGSRIGVSLGGALAVGVLPNLGIQLGGTYIQKGASIDVLADDIVNAFYADVKLDYVELSALAKARFPVGAASLHLLAGPTVSVEVRCATDLTYSLGGDTVESDSGRDYSDVACDERDYGIGVADTEAIEFGVAGGIGTDFPVGVSTRVSLDLLYRRGLSEVFADAKNRAITLRAGVSIPIG